VTPAEMRRHPVGTGPFKFVESKPNESIKLVRNPDYWKKGRPYLDGIEYTIIANRSTAIQAFVTGQFDMTFPFQVLLPLLKDLKIQAPQAVREVAPLAHPKFLHFQAEKCPRSAHRTTTQIWRREAVLCTLP
jgi:peptide/nickel transport system substrate-binding protein